MQAAALRALEFDRIREALAREALTPLGRVRALALEPSGDAAEVQRRLDLTVEAVTFVKDDGSLGISAPEDLEHSLRALEIGEEPLEPMALLGLARFVESVDDVATAVRRASAVSRPGLIEIASRVSSFDDEAKAIRRAIEPGGEIKDEASPALKEIREKLRRQRAKLRSTLESLTRSRDNAKYLQSEIVTDRHGRYVVVVRAEHREAIPGIVHGASASGASLYLEPLSTVEINNDVVALAEREKEEIRRILLALTDAFRRRADDLERTLDAGAEFDELHAKVRVAERLDAVAPALSTDGRLEFLGARHPMLRGTGLFSTDSADSGTEVEARPPSPERPNLWKKAPSPNDLLITSALVISGPNTGGKTVALKAFGLLAAMAQAGLLIPVERGSHFTPFKSIFADIGDEQSIAASLSTFSARIANLVEMDRALELPALVLLDEVGSGTDPIEGGALGTAVIEHFRRRGAIVVATTHDEALKSYAATTEGVTTAAFGFDPDTYAPTYRLIYGAPGRSLALEIAERLGMPASVVADARARRSGRDSQLAAHLSRVDQQIAELERSRSLADEERRALAADRSRVLDREAKLAEREAVLKRRLDDRLNEKLREAKSEVDRIVGQLKQKADALADRGHARAASRQPVLSTGEVGALRAEARAALGAVSDALGSDPSSDADHALAAPPAIGQTVFVAPFAAEGIVRGVSGDRVEVDVRGKRMRVALKDLRARGAGDSARATNSRTRGGSAVTAPARATSAATRELVVIGSTVDEAITRAEKFLDDALLADERRLRIVHGHGTGRLREGLTKFFRAHPLVASVTQADDKEGGAGATIIELKD
jgi:DNA mismatch repair protein MutS2